MGTVVMAGLTTGVGFVGLGVVVVDGVVFVGDGRVVTADVADDAGEDGRVVGGVDVTDGAGDGPVAVAGRAWVIVWVTISLPLFAVVQADPRNVTVRTAANSGARENRNMMGTPLRMSCIGWGEVKGSVGIAAPEYRNSGGGPTPG